MGDIPEGTRYTTVGFEHEFAQPLEGFPEEKIPYHGLTHLELATSGQRMPLTGIRFVLESDAEDAIELVSPPFLFETDVARPLPDPVDVDVVDGLIRSSLSSKVVGNATFGSMLKSFNQQEKIDFKPPRIIEPGPETMSEGSKSDPFSRSSLKQMPVMESRKGGGITSQANIATDAVAAIELTKRRAGVAKTYAEVVTHSRDPKEKFYATTNPYDSLYFDVKAVLSGAIGPRARRSPQLQSFVKLAARALSGLPAVHFIRRQKQEKETGNYATDSGDVRHLSSNVKDARAVWVKDSLASLGVGLLGPTDWRLVGSVAKSGEVAAAIKAIPLPDELESARPVFDQLVDKAMVELGRTAAEEAWDPGRLDRGVSEQPEFLSHEERLIGPRQDTYLPPEKVNQPLSGMWGDRRLHVVETRRSLKLPMKRLALERLYEATLRIDRDAAGSAIRYLRKADPNDSMRADFEERVRASLRKRGLPDRLIDLTLPSDDYGEWLM